MKYAVLLLVLTACTHEVAEGMEDPSELAPECVPLEGVYSVTATEVFGTCGSFTTVASFGGETEDGEVDPVEQNPCDVRWTDYSPETCTSSIDIFCPVTDDFGEVIGQGRWTGWVRPEDPENRLLTGEATILYEAPGDSCSGNYDLTYEAV